MTDPRPAPGAATTSPRLDLKDIVLLYTGQAPVQNALWGSYLLALFAGGSAAGAKQPNPAFYLLGAAAFAIFAIGHAYLLSRSLRLQKAAAEEIKRLQSGAVAPRSETLTYLGCPSIEMRLMLTLHALVDLLLIGTFVWRCYAKPEDNPLKLCLNQACYEFTQGHDAHHPRSLDERGIQ